MFQDDDVTLSILKWIILKKLLDPASNLDLTLPR